MASSIETLYLQISSGRGPQECQWVVTRLFDVLQAESSALGIECRQLSDSGGNKGSEGRSILASLCGPHAAVIAKRWTGTIQWIGRSPFRPQHRRRNWFVDVALVSVPVAAEIDLTDLQVTCMKSRGPGGQNVNKRSSAVRVTHRPSGLVVAARDTRSQVQNRRRAVDRIQERLEEQRNSTEAAAKTGRRLCHDRLIRGNPVRIYTGDPFRLTHPVDSPAAEQG